MTGPAAKPIPTPPRTDLTPAWRADVGGDPMGLVVWDGALAIVTAEAHARVLRAADGAEQGRLELEAAGTTVTWSPGGKRAAVTTEQGALRWEPGTGAPQLLLGRGWCTDSAWHGPDVVAVAHGRQASVFSPSGDRMG